MESAIRRLVGTGVLLIPGALGLASCAKHDTGACGQGNIALYVQGLAGLDPAHGCVATCDTSALAWTAPILDLSTTTDLSLWFAVLSCASTQAAPSEPDQAVQFYQADVELFDAVGGLLRDQRVAVSSSAQAHSGNAAACALVRVPVIDQAIAEHIAAPTTITARVKLFGVAGGGTAAETGYWDEPIDICRGCLAGCACPAPGETDAGVDAGATTTCPEQYQPPDCRTLPCWDAPDGTHCGCAS